MAKPKKVQKETGPRKKIFSISGRVIDSKTDRGIAGVRVEAWDKDLIFNDLVGSAFTDAKGDFRIEFTQSHFRELFLDREPDLFFKVFDGDKLLKSTEDSVLWNVKAGERTIEIEVDLASEVPSPAEPHGSPSPGPQISLADVLRAAGAQTALRDAIQRNNLTEVKELFTPKGMTVLKEAGISAAEQRKLLATAKFAAASGSVELGERLAKSGLTSLSRLSRMPVRRVEKMLDQMNETDRQALRQLSYTALMVSRQTREAAVEYQRSLSRDGNWYRPADGKLPIDTSGLDIGQIDFCGDGDPCFNVFSPIAYIFDLLGFIYDNWNIPSDTLEGLFHQEIDALDCDQSSQPVPQIHLAIEVLEKHLGPARVLQASARCTDIYKKSIETVLSLSGIDRKNLSNIETDLSSGSPTLEVFQRTIDRIRSEYRNVLEVVYPPPESPSAGDEEAEREYLIEQDRVKRQRESAMAEFKNLLRIVFSSFLTTYRDELIKESGSRADQLENRLFIDLRSAPSQMTNQITQVIQSLQSFVLAVRTGEIREHPRADVVALFEEEYEFDEATTWTWLSEYATWSAAMYTLVYPENVISLPEFRPSMTYGFRQAISSVPSPMIRESVDAALSGYDKHLELLGRLWPISAHVIDNVLYLFARDGGQLWMNNASLPGQKWMGWKPVGERKTNIIPRDTALYKKGNDTAIIAAYNKEEHLEDRIHTNICLFRVSLDGKQESEPCLPEIDIYETSKPFVEGPNVSQWSADGWFIETSELNNELGPSIFIIGTVVYTDFTQETKVFVATIPDPSLQSTSLSWWPERMEKRPHSPVALVNHARYWLQTGPSCGQLIIKLAGSDDSGDTNVLSHFGGDPEYATTPCMFDSFQLATNHKSAEFFLICRTRSGSIFVGWIDYPSFGEGTAYFSVFHCVSAGRARMERGWEEILLGPPRWEISRLVPETYFEERYLYFPLYAAWVLNRAGDYPSAHDSYRELYDPFGQKTKYGFPFDTYFTGEFSRPETWLADPLDPYAIAAQRKGVYLRHTILMMVKNLLDWADHEFARSGPESLNRARELYLLAERILKAPELHNLCHNGLDDLRIEIQKNFGMDAEVVIPGYADLYGIDHKEIVEETERIVREITESGGSLVEISRRAEVAVANAVATAKQMHAGKQLGDTYRNSNDRIEAIENAVLAKNFPQFPGSNPGNGALVFSPWRSPETRSIAFTIPPNPLLKAFSFHILANLAKLYADLNIAGDWTSQFPASKGLGNRYGFPPGPWSLTGFIEPPRYRYSYLAEKARQQAGYAQQLGVALLQAIEKADAAAFERLQAEHAIAVAEATVTLKDLMRAEANNASWWPTSRGRGLLCSATSGISALTRVTALVFWASESEEFPTLNSLA